MAFSLLDQATPTSAVGRTGGSLGVGGLTGTVVSLDTYQNPGDPSARLVGLGTGATTTNSDHSLVYAATVPATGLRTGTHTVDVTVTPAGHLVVTLDGTGPGPRGDPATHRPGRLQRRHRRPDRRAHRARRHHHPRRLSPPALTERRRWLSR